MASSLMLRFNVKRNVPELLPPAEATPYLSKEVSDLDDQEGVRLYMSMIFVYPSPTVPMAGGFDPARDVRRGLSKALVYYYPLAGRLREGPNRKLSVECTGEGILFCDADADVQLQQFGAHLPLPRTMPTDGLFLDAGSAILGSPLMTVQVTRFPCGGYSVGVKFLHVMFDGTGFGMFMMASAELAGNVVAPSVPPVWDRELLRSRTPPRITFDHREYIHDDPLPKINQPVQPMALDWVQFTAADVASLRAQLPAYLQKAATSFDILTACLWRCRTAALGSAPNEVVRLIMPVNCRSKLNPPLPRGYYGNSFILPVSTTKAGKLVHSNLGYAVELVREAKAMATDAYVRSTLDFLVSNGRIHYVVANTYLVSDVRWLFDFEKMDWGWGQPDHIWLPELGEELISYLVLFKNSQGRENGVLVPICLPEFAMEKFMVEVKKMVSNSQVHDRINEN